MPNYFDERVEQAWTNSSWIIEDMFDGGMCFFEGYVPAIELDSLGSVLPQLSKSAPDFQYSTWSNDTDESDWNRSYSVQQYVSFFRSGRILLLHADCAVAFAGFDFTFKLIFEPDANLEIIFYRENLLPRSETRSRFFAACNYFRRLQSAFHGEALFIGPDTLNYPVWPESIPDEWQRLL